MTTDWTSALDKSRTGCTLHHTGTSAAAPIAAGLIALMLDVQPCLTWRDVQYLIILTAQKVGFLLDCFLSLNYTFTGLSRGGLLGRSGRLKCPHFAYSLDQSDIDFARNFGKLQKLSISE